MTPHRAATAAQSGEARTVQNSGTSLGAAKLAPSIRGCTVRVSLNLHGAAKLAPCAVRRSAGEQRATGHDRAPQ
ncbi:MAG: hypothetical protein DI639_01510 [Leifsonia xyli]|nr:MAG: hypothetical protein DI639_01510 [Leifsonia xyli]